MTKTYIPPVSREQAVEEIMRSGFTTSALLAVSMAFPLPGEIAETVSFNREHDGELDYYLAESCHYLEAWGRNICPVAHGEVEGATVSV